MKKIFVIIGALLAALFATAQQTRTFQQSVDTALANNRNAKYGVPVRKSNETAYQHAQLNVLPNPNATALPEFDFGRWSISEQQFI